MLLGGSRCLPGCWSRWPSTLMADLRCWWLSVILLFAYAWILINSDVLKESINRNIGILVLWGSSTHSRCLVELFTAIAADCVEDCSNP